MTKQNLLLKIRNLINFKYGSFNNIEDKLQQVVEEDDELNILLENLFEDYNGIINKEELDSLSKTKALEKIFSIYLNINNVLIVEGEKSSNEISENLDDFFSENIVEQYIHDIKKYPILTYEEEKELLSKINKDPKAKEKLINHNLRYVVSIARQYTKYKIEFMELIQEGNLGLVKAVSKYKSEYDVRFLTYAGYYIEQRIRRAVKIKRNIKLPQNIEDRIPKILFYVKRYYNENNRKPTMEEISNEFNMDIDVVKGIFYAVNDIISIDTPVSEDENCCLAECIEDKTFRKTEDVAVERVFFEQIFRSLTPKEKEAIKLKYGVDDETERTFDECGKILGVKKQAVQCAEKKAREKIALKLKYVK